jgi:hypothetical protein
MSDQLRDEVAYFKTWLALARDRREGLRRDLGKNVPELERKLERAERCLKTAQEQKCPDLVGIFADVAVQLEDRLEVCRKKAEKAEPKES